MAERPLECSHCKKPVKVIYKEIIDNGVTCTEMCADCPILQQKLYGSTPSQGKVSEGWAEGETGLFCGSCGTSLEMVKTGNPLGCSQCYEVFADVLISELIASSKIPPRLKSALTAKKSQPIHIGKSPGKPLEFTPSNHLTALNEALNEALKRENYEQAAWLRDQIKALTEKPNEGKK